MHENRETSLVSAPADRSGKANNHKPDAYAKEESDCAVVPVKRSNKEAVASAEVVEGRAQTEENDAELDTSPTQSGERVSQGLGGVRQVAREKKQERFTALLHHLTVELLRESYYALKRNAAPGVDGVRWSEYEGGWKIGSRIYRAGCTVERIGHNHREECTYRKPMGASVRWASLRWRTKSFSKPW
jgi:RNA-directed DNA polymerase